MADDEAVGAELNPRDRGEDGVATAPADAPDRENAEPCVNDPRGTAVLPAMRAFGETTLPRGTAIRG